MTLFAQADEDKIITGVLDRLQSEYDIIQGKIDNIGDFKFKVRGWLITVYSAFLYSIFSGQVPITTCIPVGLFIVLIFYFLEREQVILQHRLSNRAKKIEKAVHILGQKIHEVGINKERLIKSILNEIESSPRIGVIMISGQRLAGQGQIKFKWTVKHIWKAWLSAWQKFRSYSKTFWLFIVLAILTVAINFLATDKRISSHWNLIKGAETVSPEISITNNSIDKHINKRFMRSNIEIERVEEEVSALLSQIDFGDISDIDTYWDSLSEALLDLPIKDWMHKPSSGSDVSVILNSIDVSNASELCQLAEEMKQLCDSGSNSSISEEDLDKLQRKASKFERKVDAFLDELDELMKE
jgi:hypothetical protein